MSRGRQLLAPALMTLIMLTLLISLGVWQLHRMAWKEGLLTAINRAEGAPAVPLPAEPSPFTKVSVDGVLRHDRVAYYGAEVRRTPAGHKMGAQLIVPLDRGFGLPILVDRGWAPFEAVRPIGQPVGQIRIEGYVRLPEPHRWFSAEDDPATRRFYTMDPLAMGAAIGLPRVAPFIVVALGQLPPEMFPDPARRMPRPNNDHLSYAITWFSLAAVLIVIFVLFARKVVRA